MFLFEKTGHSIQLLSQVMACLIDWLARLDRPDLQNPEPQLQKKVTF